MDSYELGRTFRDEAGRAVATLTRYFNSIDVAEEAVQEAFVIAAQKWQSSGVPPNPGAWIITTARNRAIDKLRRESSRDDRHAQAAMLHEQTLHYQQEPEEVGPVNDDRLRLIFTCCHPSLTQPAQVALTLRLLGGLTTDEIARAFLVPETTMAQRIVRAKNKIREEQIPYRIPTDAELPDRLPAVLATLYLIFNEGYTATSGNALVRDDLCEEAIRLTRILVDLMPDEAEVLGLLALMLLTVSRRVARVAPDGSMVLMADQDRSLWNRALAGEGRNVLDAAMRRNMIGPYQLQAAIAATHSVAPSLKDTNWQQIVMIYDDLLALTPTPVVALNRAVAVAEVDGPEAALKIVEELDLDAYYLFHATRADLLRRLNRVEAARDAYTQAIELASNASERAFLQSRIDELPKEL